jgi:hypothetical protein
MDLKVVFFGILGQYNLHRDYFVELNLINPMENMMER